MAYETLCIFHLMFKAVILILLGQGSLSVFIYGVHSLP